MLVCSLSSIFLFSFFYPYHPWISRWYQKFSRIWMSFQSQNELRVKRLQITFLYSFGRWTILLCWWGETTLFKQKGKAWDLWISFILFQNDIERGHVVWDSLFCSNLMNMLNITISREVRESSWKKDSVLITILAIFSNFLDDKLIILQFYALVVFT